MTTLIFLAALFALMLLFLWALEKAFDAAKKLRDLDKPDDSS